MCEIFINNLSLSFSPNPDPMLRWGTTRDEPGFCVWKFDFVPVQRCITAFAARGLVQIGSRPIWPNTAPRLSLLRKASRKCTIRDEGGSIGHSRPQAVPVRARREPGLVCSTPPPSIERNAFSRSLCSRRWSLPVSAATGSCTFYVRPHAPLGHHEG